MYRVEIFAVSAEGPRFRALYRLLRLIRLAVNMLVDFEEGKVADIATGGHLKLERDGAKVTIYISKKEESENEESG